MNQNQQLSQKELNYVEDQLSAEQLTMTKLRFYAEQTNDPEIREECQNLANKHQQHYNTLLKHLRTNQNLQ
ncbi:spore coat protein [Alkalicella caledoniensis]|uniref:Spore coat protein n=1 Tax=Alkalicella caledoniensis TaxID=2731377 RepID=A0A7G9W4U5_ALKCA|nr:spore coat protein [Alkalicella caledoniensis]QNO13707.1 spore coat protein [Alkalicella caledoniensis]